MRTLSFIFVLTIASFCHAGSLEFLTTEVPPMAFTKNNQLTGFCIELVREIQARLKEPSSITSVPWPRAYHRGVHEKNIVLICPKRTSERESIFKWVGPVLISETSLFKRADAKVNIKTIQDAKKAPSILIPRIFYSYQELLNMGFTNLDAVADTQTAVKMLIGGRSDLLALDKRQVQPVLKAIKSPPDSVTFLMDINPAIAYLAFSVNVSDDVIKKWQNHLNDMKKDGAYDRIYKNWFN